MNNYYKKNQTLDDLVKKEEKKRRKNQAKSVAENSFYAKPTNSGIMKPSKPKFGSIQEIKDAIKVQKVRIDDSHQYRWDNLSTFNKKEAEDAKRQYESEKQRLTDLEINMDEAYGLGKNGYWNRQSKTYGQGKQVQNKQLDNVVHSYGQQTMPKTPSVKPNNVFSNNLELDKQVHQTGGVISNRKTPEEIQEKLNAQKEAQLSLQNIPRGMTAKGVLDMNVGRFETNMKKVHDDFLSNAKKNPDSKTAKEDFAKYRNDYQALVMRRDAFNRAKMGIDASLVEGNSRSGGFMDDVITKSGESNNFVHGSQYFGSDDNDKLLPDIIQNHPHPEREESMGIFSGGGGGFGGAGDSWGEGDEKLSLEDIQRINQVSGLSESFMSTTDNKETSESEAIMIDFTTPEFEQAIELYSYLKDGKSIGEDLAAQIMADYPKIAEKWGYDRLVVEIDLHYMLYQMGYKTDRTALCNISNENDTSWGTVDKLTGLQKFDEFLQFPK